MSQKVAELLLRLEKRLDRSAIVSADEAGPRYREDPDGKTGALPEFVLRPRTAGEVSDILRLCNEARQRLVVQGGRTGLAGAARIQP
uniref:FAD-binding protein n=1 Tax=Mesorhizobium mediterraneum TaxID=43617 RepID=UPI001784D072